MVSQRTTNNKRHLNRRLSKPLYAKILKMYKFVIYDISILLLSILITACGAGKSLTDDQKPNILLIVADDLGYTDLGCFGSEISTPNLDALANVGILNTSFYTSPTCAPTRAMLLTGVDNHKNGLGSMGRFAKNQEGLPGYEGYLNFDVVTFPKLLQENGYHTLMAGKWHLARPIEETSQWPDKRGFDRSFSLIQAGAGHFSDQQPLFSSWKATYTEDGEIIENLPENFYSSDYYTQKITEYIDESIGLNKPFFAYLAFTAPHWPIQVPDEYIDLYEDCYKEGYEVLAQKRLERGKQLGIIDETTSISLLTPNVIPWDELSLDEQRKSSRIMEVYAAMVERLDTNVGKLIDHLKLNDLYDNTLIVFMADNGAEGNSLWGVGDTREWVAENYDNSLNNIGRKNSYVFTGPSWAQVSSLPFKWYKSFSTEGGVRSPLIISYPKWKHNFRKINRNYISVMDLAPTFLELAAVEYPKDEYDGKKIYPIDGTSLLNWLDGGSAFAHEFNEVHCWELYGRIGVRKGDWKANWYDSPYGTESWELYNLRTDPGELNDLADINTEKLEELKTEWSEYASEYQVILPNEKVSYGTDEIWRDK